MAVAHDEGLAEQMREDIGDMPGLSERRMFGGLAFMVDGHMLCGVHGKGAMYRVGKPNMAAALDHAGVDVMRFTGRPMGGFVDVSDDAMQDDRTRLALLDMARGFVASLPPK